MFVIVVMRPSILLRMHRTTEKIESPFDSIYNIDVNITEIPMTPMDNFRVKLNFLDSTICSEEGSN